MARPCDPRRRTEILDAVIAHLAETGIAHLSLRPPARALGHSTRVLTHHFADKDALITAVLAAAGRLGGRVPEFLADRADFVAGALRARGLAPDAARVHATFLNSAYAGLQADVLVTGDRARTEAAPAELCALADSWTRA
ncbi:TetR family transcriptional regulator [Streptomyces angustmyceticus]|uniref:HTH tetR-type domain-containing protein n=1 Tax=Streptomyces angustmyceticus TaxID=285578 RepID=A0A5J4LHM8_9ACTN|nr:TetR family transcriptional regulator [Streptomyces angustmyceticus]UAL67622.1 TetR family transcriptional regulator [Streptomyces angustmyceticus]GES31411.1 hypothetical protein San01_38980 [Streptomyces angustmyceticus]